MSDEGFISDAIVSRSLTPLLEEAAEVLCALDAGPRAQDQIAGALGDAYFSGLADGARHAVGEIAAEAEGRGLRLMLAPELQSPQHEDEPW